MNNEPKQLSANESPAGEGKKKPFSMRSDMAKGLRVRTALRAGAGADNGTQPQENPPVD